MAEDWEPVPEGTPDLPLAEPAAFAPAAPAPPVAAPAAPAKKGGFRPRNPVVAVLLLVVGVMMMLFGSIPSSPSTVKICDVDSSCVIDCRDPFYSGMTECQPKTHSGVVGLGFLMAAWGTAAVVVHKRHLRSAASATPGTPGVAPKSFKDSFRENMERMVANAKVQQANAAASSAERQSQVMANKAAHAALAFCENCRQNVSPVRKGSASKLILTGGLGYALSSKDSCPMCRAKNLSPARPPPQVPPSS